MAAITGDMVKQLREKTGAGMMDCKKALIETEGDVEKSIELLRKQGLATAAKKSGRVAAEGTVFAYIHGNGRIGVLVEVNIETDFAARNEIFRDFVKDIAMQIAASKPEYIKKEEVPAAIIEKEKEILKAQAIKEGKPEKIIDKMVEGRIEKYYKENCLMDQAWIKEPDKTISQLMTEKIAIIGENMNIRRFARFEVGEGIEKKEDDFAAEVMKQING